MADTSYRRRTSSRMSDSENVVEGVVSIHPAVPSTMRMTTMRAFEGPDTTRKQRKMNTAEKRGAFQWLPIHDQNDMAIGSWYFFWGSFIGLIFPILPLFNIYYHFIPDNDDADDYPLSVVNMDITYGLLMLSSLLYAIGSLMFVRGFMEPPVPPMFNFDEHSSTDELVAAWLFFYGTIPLIPFAIIFLYNDPNSFPYWAMLVIAIVATIGCYLFVLATYPSNKYEEECQLAHIIRDARLFAPDNSLLYHIQNDWLMASWILFWASLVSTLFFVYYTVAKFYARDVVEVFIMFLSALSMFFFTIGCAYYVAGSYPAGMVLTDRASDHESQGDFYKNDLDATQESVLGEDSAFAPENDDDASRRMASTETYA